MKILELLTSDENDIYRHVFVPDGRTEQRCEICDMPEEKHAIIDLGLIEQALSEYYSCKIQRQPIIVINRLALPRKRNQGK